MDSTDSTRKTRRAVAIVRVSEQGDRPDDRLATMDNQVDAIRRGCKVHELALIADPYPEHNVSGGAALENRVGLKRAVEDIEAGRAEVLVVAHFDRLVRSLKVQAQVVERVEAAGGQVLALDIGRVTNGTAGEWLSSTFLGAVNEYVRRSIGERSAAGVATAVARGAHAARTPLGYRRGSAGVLEIDASTAATVRAAFHAAAADGLHAAMAILRERVPERRWRTDETRRLLRNRVYLGESRHGDLVNKHAHEALVDLETWSAAQTLPQGRRSNGEYLLSGIASCGACGSPMVGQRQVVRGRAYSRLRCGACHRVSIGHPALVTYVQDTLAEALGDATIVARFVVPDVASAREAMEQASANLATYQVATEGLDVGALRAGLEARLAVLREAEDAYAAVAGAAAQVAELPAADELGDADQLLRAVRVMVESITVAPGRGRVEDRVAIVLRAGMAGAGALADGLAAQLAGAVVSAA